MLGLIKYDPLEGLIPKRNLYSWFFGPALLEKVETKEEASLANVDIVEDEKTFKVKAEVPGFAKEEIKVEVEGDRLILKAEHREEKSEEKGDYRVRELRSGAVYRTFVLPENVDGGNIEAAIDKGILTVTIPKTEEVKPRRIEVTVH
ncbi:MAG: Hsp20/alpha crystallin family protein [Deltaproteobacteria bacterium]|nr:Hsp20/alpha crystallin family protein [Deltaproteobacteria bacterium]